MKKAKITVHRRNNGELYAVHVCGLKNKSKAFDRIALALSSELKAENGGEGKPFTMYAATIIKTGIITGETVLEYAGFLSETDRTEFFEKYNNKPEGGSI
jgi:hypothetical protein